MQAIGRMTGGSIRTGALVALIAALPTLGIAQQQLSPVRVEGAASVRDNARADTLEVQARTLHAIKREWRNAARLHRRAGELRGDDPRSVQSFRMAAWMYSAAQAPGVARSMMVRAAEQAAGVGDIESAAVSWIDAAHLAVADERFDALPGLLRKARILIEAPLFPPGRRADLLVAIGESPRLAQAWAEGAR